MAGKLVLRLVDEMVEKKDNRMAGMMVQRLVEKWDSLMA
jgi:hypothetical protein